MVTFVFVWLPNFVVAGFCFAILCALLYLGVVVTEHFLYGRRNYVKDNNGDYLGNTRWDYVLFILSIIVIMFVVIWQWAQT